MSNNARQVYMEGEIVQADPVKLVRILFRAALEAVANARRHLREGDIAARSRQISKASAILNELALSLDHEKGGDVSRALVELYDYIQGLLHKANFEQMDPPLADAERLLETLLDGWENCEAQHISSRVYTIAPRENVPPGYIPLNCVY